MTCELVYIGLGSNLGNRADSFNKALELLRERRILEDIICSTYYKTAPWGYQDQPWFLNAALEAKTSLSPGDLLDKLKILENDIGRKPTIRWGPRALDLDILLYGNRIIESENLSIPHEHLQHRAFVLAPLLEIAPDLTHPKSNRHLVDYWNELPEDEKAGVEKWVESRL